MALPKRRHSKTRRDKRRTHYILNQPAMTTCSNCRRLITNHQICPYCGYYKGREIIKIETKEKKEKR